MKKIKIIDLLNKIANGEELPEEIRFEGKIFEKQYETSFYCTGFGIFEEAFVLEDLNKEVEIIEEDKEIEKIGNDYYHKTQPEQNQIFQRKINEIIDKVNSLEKKQ